MEFIDQFEKHYDYDCNYMRKMAKSAPDAFETFVNFLPMGQVGASLPPDILWTAKISATLTEDCGACVQLSIKMAIEAGVSKELIKLIVKTPEQLETKYTLIYSFAKEIALNGENHVSKQKQVASTYSQEQLTELALAIASTKIYPTIKRALGEFQSCSIYDFEF